MGLFLCLASLIERNAFRFIYVACLSSSFLLLQSSIPLNGCTTVYLSPSCGHLIVSNF